MWEIIFIVVALLCFGVILYDHFDNESYVSLGDLGEKSNFSGHFQAERSIKNNDEPVSAKYRGYRYDRYKQRRAKGQHSSDE